jgi:hypothetical protein
MEQKCARRVPRPVRQQRTWCASAHSSSSAPYFGDQWLVFPTHHYLDPVFWQESIETWTILCRLFPFTDITQYPKILGTRS